MRTLMSSGGAAALSAFHQALVVILINIPSVSFGLALGWVSLVSGEAADGGDKGAVFAAVTTFLACFVAVPISAKIITYGRKYAVMAASACFVLCWSLKLVSVSASDGWMIGGRLAAGIGGTIAWTLAPLLASEMCSEGWCGAAVSALPLAHNAGILLMYLAADARIHHSTVIWSCLGVSVFHFFVFMFIPESPSFLASKGKNEEARSSLAWLRGRSTDSPKLDAEFKTLPPAEKGDDSSLSRALDLFRDRQRRWTFAVGFVAVVGQEMCGILAITQYAERLFILTRDRAAEVLIDASPEGEVLLATPARHALILGAVQIVASAVSLYLVERLGRRPLIVGCSWAVGLSLGGAAGAVWAGKAEVGALAVALAVAVDAAGLQAAPYALLSDMFAYEAVLQNYTMGLMEKLSSWLGGPAAGKEITILVLGLDHSGKTSLLNALRPPDRKVTSEPTLAPRQDNFTFGGISVVAVEAGGARRVRALWERQYAAASGVLWVADAADALRLAVARDEMQLMLEHPAMRARRLPLLVCANKADLPHALPPAQVAAALGLERVTDKPWHVCATSAVSGAGLTDGLAWLTRQLRDLHTDN